MTNPVVRNEETIAQKTIPYSEILNVVKEELE